MNAVGGNQFGLDPLFSCFQSYPQYWLKSEDGSVEYGSIQPETKTALENISKLYADGVIDPETLVRSDSKEPLLAGKVGIFFGPSGGVHIHLRIQLCQVQQTGGHISHLFLRMENIIRIWLSQRHSMS